MKVGIISNVESCIPLLQFLRANNIETILYIGSYSPQTNISSLISFCNSNNISVEVENNSIQLVEWIHLKQPDYCFVYGYKKLINVNSLGKFQKSIFNIHPGKLPSYRGASPIFWQLKNGEKQIGISIHFLNEKYDAGAIVWQKEIANEKHSSYGLVEMIFANLLIEGVHFVINTGIEKLQKQKVEQDKKNDHRYFKPTLYDVLIDWQKMSAKNVEDLVKACNPWNKGAITLFNSMEMKVIDAEIDILKTEKLAGEILDLSSGVKVACAENTVIKINELIINDIFVPARFSYQFGLMVGQHFDTLKKT